MDMIKLQWAQFGAFDSFDVIRDTASMAGLDDADLPAPLATGLSSMYYEDTDVVAGTAYYYLVRVWKGSESALLAGEVRAVAAMPWQPTGLSLAVWLDAKDQSTITKDGTGKVSAWNDKSGNSRHALQADSSKQPLYDGTKECLSATGALVELQGNFTGIPINTINEYTVFIVARPTKTSGYVEGESSSGVNFYSNANNNSTFFQVAHSNSSSTSGVVVPVVSITTNGTSLTETRNSLAPYLISRSHSIGSNKMLVSVERKPSGATRSGLCGDYRAGSTSGVAALGWETYAVLSQYVSVGMGDIHEVILLHSGSLGDETIQKIEGYLAHKWEIASLLPSDHPYKADQPYF